MANPGPSLAGRPKKNPRPETDAFSYTAAIGACEAAAPWRSSWVPLGITMGFPKGFIQPVASKKTGAPCFLHLSVFVHGQLRGLLSVMLRGKKVVVMGMAPGNHQGDVPEPCPVPVLDPLPGLKLRMRPFFGEGSLGHQTTSWRFAAYGRWRSRQKEPNKVANAETRFELVDLGAVCEWPCGNPIQSDNL